jgi:hypothetical protein
MIAYIVSSGTIWSNWLDPNAFGSWGRVGRVLEDNLEIVGNEIRDRWLVHALFLTLAGLQIQLSNPSQQVRVSCDIYWILNDLISHGVKVAIASQNSNQDLYVYSVNRAGTSNLT